MKNKTNNIISVITCIVLVMCVYRIKSLEGEIYSLRNSLGQRIDNISRDINSIYYNIDSRLEQQASLITADIREFASADIDAGSVQVVCSVTAKEYTPGVTQAFVYVDGQQFELSLVDDRFTGTITVPLFEDTFIDAISFRENDMVRNQSLDWHFFPRYEYLTLVYADFNWSGRGTKSKKDDSVYLWQIDDGTIDIDVDRENGKAEIQSIDMVEVIDGVEAKRTSIPLTPTDNGDKAWWRTEEKATPEYADINMDSAQLTNFTYDLNGYVFEIPFGSTLDVFVETVDGDNLVHRNQIAQWKVSEDGQDIGEYHDWWHGAEGFIYDKDGNLLYGNEELYK